MSPRVSWERLAALHGGSARFFGNWLGQGIPSFLETGTPDVFPGAANYVGWAGSIEEDLAFIFGVMPAGEASAFRSGVAIALAEMPLDGPYAGKALKAGVRLAALVAALEVVDVVTPVLMRAARRRLPELEELYRLSFDVVVELATPAPVAVRCLRMLITSRGFRETLAAPALVALCDVAPTDLASHLALLSRPLDAQYGAHRLDRQGRTTGERDHLLERVAELVPAAAVIEAFSGIRRSMVPSDWSVRDWFTRGLPDSEAALAQALWREVQELSAANATVDDDDGGFNHDEAGRADEFSDALGRLPEMAA